MTPIFTPLILLHHFGDSPQVHTHLFDGFLQLSQEILSNIYVVIGALLPNHFLPLTQDALAEPDSGAVFHLACILSLLALLNMSFHFGDHKLENGDDTRPSLPRGLPLELIIYFSEEGNECQSVDFAK